MQRSPPFDQPGLPIHGGQGPEWLSQFILNPPGWVNPSLKVLAAVVAAIAAYRLYQRGFELPLTTQIEVQRVVTHILGVMVVSLALVTYADLPYWWDATGGALIGIGSALIVQAVAARFPDGWVSNDPREKVMAAWTILAVAGLILPEFAGLQQSGLLAVNARWYLVVLSAGMAIYDGALIHHERQLLDD